MNFFLILLILLIFLPYAGTTILQFTSGEHGKSRDPLENYVVGFSIGQLIFIKIVTLLGVSSLINFNNILFAVLIFFAMALVLDSRRGWIAVRGYLNVASVYFSDPRNTAVSLILIPIAILVAALIVDLSPPRHADALRYHLEYSNYILNSGFLPFVPHNQLALATDAELLFSTIIIGFGDGYVKLAVYVNLIICILAAYRYFESFGAMIMKYAVWFFVASPILFLASTIVKPDTIQLLYFVVSLLLINKLYHKYSLVNLVLAAVFLAEVIALKWTGILPVVSLTCYLIYAFIINLEDRKTLFKLLFAIGVAIIIVPSFWYVRNYFATGNPIWPLMNQLFAVNDGSLLYEISTQKSSRSEIIEKYSFLGYLTYTFFFYKPAVLGGLGISCYLSVPLAIYRDVDKKVIHNLVFVFIYLVFWYLAQASFRHLIWVLPSVAVIASFGYLRSKLFQSGVLKVLRKIIIILVFFQLLFIFIYSSFFVKYFFGLVNEGEYYATTPNYHAFKAVENDIDNPLKKVLVIIPSSEIYYLHQPHVDGNSQHSAIIDYNNIKGISELLNRLKELEVGYILFSDELLQANIYSDLRKVIGNSSTFVKQYDSKVIKNRLSGSSIITTLTLVALNDKW